MDNAGPDAASMCFTSIAVHEYLPVRLGCGKTLVTAAKCGEFVKTAEREIDASQVVHVRALYVLCPIFPCAADPSVGQNLQSATIRRQQTS